MKNDLKELRNIIKMEGEKKSFLPLDYNERYNPGFNLTFKTCQGETKHGDPCPNAPQENEEFCGKHMHQKEDEESEDEEHEQDTDEETDEQHEKDKDEESEDEEHEKDKDEESEDEEHEKSQDMSKEDTRTKIKLTETIYILVRPDREGNPDIDLFIDPNNSSTREDLVKFYLNNESLLKINKNYFLKLRILEENMYFIPIFNRLGMIVNFPYILEKNFDKIGAFTFVGTAKGYPRTTIDRKSLHEIINGKKAEKGGWKLIKECKGKIFNKEEKRFVKLEARWITMISGRSVDKYDPDPESIKFLYYYDEINNCNIKVAPWNDKSSWLTGAFEGPPHPNNGEVGQFYKDLSGNIYVKIDEHAIDHINIKPEDAREYNLREICVSSNESNRAKKGERCGVKKTNNNYVGYVNFRYQRYSKSFGTRDEAACFYDYYTLALHGVEVTHNNILTRKEINRVLLEGVDAIPEFFRYKRMEKELPKGITLKKGTQLYTVRRQYKTLKIEETFKTLEGAQQKLDWFNNEKQKMIDMEKEEIVKMNKSKCKDGYGYISIKNTKIGEIQNVKLNEETFIIFGHLSWSFDSNGRPVGIYKGKKKSLHIHTMEHYFGEYNKKLHGTIDHKNIDPLDCTIESLRPASHSLQIQNRNTKSILGFQGITLANDKFKAAMSTQIKKNGKTRNKSTSKRFYILEDALRFYNKLVIEKFGLDEKGNPVGKVHIVPNTTTYVKDLYNRKVLTEEKIKNAGKMELQSILAVNPDWRIGILSEPKKFPRNALEPHREEILKYYLAQKNVKLNIIKH